MPILQEVNDPYANSNASALAGLTNGGGLEAQARAQTLQAQIAAANMQQQKAAQEMRLADEKARQENTKFGWETSAHKQNEAAQDAAGRYWGTQPVAPVGGSPAEMERYYREQNYYDQMARQMSRSGKGAEDIAKAMGDFQTNYRTAHPSSVGPSAMPDGSPIPQMPQSLAPEAQKKWQETNGKQVADAQMDQIMSQTAARKKLPELVNMRDAWENAAQHDAIGGLSATTPARWIANVAGTDREVARQSYEGVRAQVLNQNSGDHKGEGAVSNYERELYGKPYAEVNAANAEVGRARMGDQFALTLRSIGVDPAHAQEISQHITHGAPRAAIDRLVRDLQSGNMNGINQFLEAARISAQSRMGGGQ